MKPGDKVTVDDEEAEIIAIRQSSPRCLVFFTNGFSGFTVKTPKEYDIQIKTKDGKKKWIKNASIE
jgi:hypothetical protein